MERQKCCCCSLTVGGYIIGSMGVFMSFAAIPVTFGGVSDISSIFSDWTFYALTIFVIIHLSFTCVLLHGIRTRNILMMTIWIFFRMSILIAIALECIKRVVFGGLSPNFMVLVFLALFEEFWTIHFISELRRETDDDITGGMVELCTKYKTVASKPPQTV